MMLDKVAAFIFAYLLILTVVNTAFAVFFSCLRAQLAQAEAVVLEAEAYANSQDIPHWERVEKAIAALREGRRTE